MKLKSMLASAVIVPALLLAGCGGSGVDGKYKIETSAMGFAMPSQELVIEDDFLLLNNARVEVKEWKKEGNTITAIGPNGTAVLNLVKNDDGSLGMGGLPAGGMAKVKITKI